MKKTLWIAALSLLSIGCGRQTSVPPAIPLDSDIESQVKKIVSQMSLDDKVGQMCEVVVDLVCADSVADGSVRLDSVKLKTIFDEYRVGSILNTPQGHAQDAATWNRVISGIQEASMKYIGIPDVYGVDQNHGTTYTAGGTLFPQEINMAASWNRDLVREGAAYVPTRAAPAISLGCTIR